MKFGFIADDENGKRFRDVSHFVPSYSSRSIPRFCPHDTHSPNNVSKDSVSQGCAKRIHGLKVHLADHATAIDRFFSGFSSVMSRYRFPETQ